MFDRKKEVLLGVAFTALAFIILSHTMFPRIWSPYNRLTVTDSYLWKNPDGIGSILPQEKGEWIKIGKRIDVCDLFYMDITDFPRVTKKYPKFFGSIETYEYNLPYVILKPERVLIVGSGGGNDVAAALRYGVKKIDAVEIDPVIAEIGKKYHPERPYDSEKVKLYINDARYFFNTIKGKYDLIVFGFLDSHSLFSTHSSVRLDNYVYTLEAFKQVKSLLEPDGSVAVSFAFSKEWMIDRFDYILEEVFGTRPQIIAGHRTLLIGGLRNDYEELIRSSHIKASKLEKEREKIPISTDDWPFLYQYKKKLPSTYLWALLIMATVSVLWVHNIIPRENLKREAHFFWLGAAFLLIEIKNISQLALLWGSTWVVNAVVLGLIMILILGANCIVHFLKVKKMEVIYLFLFISILISYFLPLNIFIRHGLIMGKTLPALIYLFPIFFAGIIFAASFKNCDNAQGALGLNLIGGVLGGFLEYSSVVIGFKSLTLIALFLYGVSWLDLKKVN